jgi:(R,R)-butanediol dehydrogenase/meso-butanediol dehydrogenase/diacetyl reductase|tara:strand:+ start:7284 stop:8300 length:1017 start_codon:yes stop_codon:yes gene_type:complete
MKAMLLGAPNKVELEEVENPTTDNGNSVVRITHSGVCGTDLKIFSGGIPANYPLIMGHEMIGEVTQAGDSTSPQAGTRVIVDPVLYCGKCFHCNIGQSQLCPNGGLIGRDQDGGFAEYVAVPPKNVFAMPDKITNHEAPLIQVLTTVMHAQQMANVSSDDTVVILGLGVGGLLHVQLAKARGAKTIIGITRSEWKREVAENIGADFTLAPNEQTKQLVLDATNGIGADLVIESAGKLSVLAQAMDLVRLGGRVLGYGIHTNTEGALPFYDMYFKEIQFINARAATDKDFSACLKMFESGKINLNPLISDILPLDQLGKAMEMVGTDAPQRMKIIMEHS